MTLILLPATLEADMSWENELRLAQEIGARGEKVLWQFDFGLDRANVVLDDPSHFLSLSLAIDQFTKTLFQSCREWTEGVVLYQGDADFHERLLWSGPICDDFQDWLVETSASDNSYTRRLFCMNLFANYVHRLASYLPDDVQPYCFFQGEEESIALRSHLFSKERFGHIRLHKFEEEVATGFVFPSDELCSLQLIEKLDVVMQDLIDKNTIFRVIPESLLTEEWYGMETLIAVEDGVTKSGRRMLQGFEASGGNVLWVKNKSE